MDTPRFARNLRPAGLTAVLVVLLGPALARAGQTTPDAGARVRSAPAVRNDAQRNPQSREREADRPSACDDQPEEATTLPPSVLLQCLRLLHVLNSVCALSPETLSQNKPPPLVVKPPPWKKADDEKPKDTGNPTPAETPEPGTLLSGLVGSALGLAAWWRHRRGKLVRELEDPKKE